MTTALLRAALDALVYHTDQTRPIHSTQMTIDAIRAHLAAQPLHEQLREMGEAHAAQPAPVPAESVAWAKQTDKKLRITHMDMHGEEGWRPLVFGDAAPVPADLTMTRDELVAAAESIGMRFPAPAPVPVPLSDEQIDKILERERMRWAKSSPPTYEFALAFARAIERAHGIAASPEVP
jgi:hypothetical protein